MAAADGWETLTRGGTPDDGGQRPGRGAAGCRKRVRRGPRRATALGRWLVALLVVACADGAPQTSPPAAAAGASTTAAARFGGASMGTTFSVQAHGLPQGVDRPRLAADVARLLDDLDAALSTWRDDSQLARFNARRDEDWFAVTADTATIVREAADLAALTGGALDVSVGPLVALWGFGPSGRREVPPSAAELAAARARVGGRHLQLRDEPAALRKLRPDLAVDLSALAKGHAIDRIGAHLDGLGVPHWLVEFGGELRGRGRAADGAPWRVAVADPDRASGPAFVVQLSDAAIATSGDTRNAFEHGGRRYGHVIDPRTGWPADHDLASVSVVAQTALRADGLATALLVLGPDDGPRLAEREGLAALFLVRQDDALVARATPAFARWLAPAQAGATGDPAPTTTEFSAGSR